MTEGEQPASDGRRRWILASAAASGLAVLGVAAFFAWPYAAELITGKDMEVAADDGAEAGEPGELDPALAAEDAAGTAEDVVDEPDIGLLHRVALDAEQARTIALTDEVARLRWLALQERRQCIPEEPPAPDPPQLSYLTPPPALEPPPPEPEPEPDPPVQVALADPPPIMPERDPPPPPPPPQPDPPPPAVVVPDPVPPVVAQVDPPQPPAPTPPPPSGQEFDQRIQREGGQQANSLVTLIWNNRNDLDLHIICPNGRRVYFADMQGCGSRLDIDMNASTNRLSNQPVENIVWPASNLPPGTYQVYVDHYANHGAPDPTDYRVRVRVNGEERQFSGRIRHGEPPRLITTFTIG